MSRLQGDLGIVDEVTKHASGSQILAGSDVDEAESGPIPSGGCTTVVGMTDDDYSARKHCPHCDQPARRATEVKRDHIIRGFYLCPRGHSWGMHWREP